MPSANTTIVVFEDGRRVLLSYDVPVAVYVPLVPSPGPLFATEWGYFKTARRYSRTTSRHVNEFTRPFHDEVHELPDDQFMALIAPLTNPRGSE